MRTSTRSTLAIAALAAGALGLTGCGGGSSSHTAVSSATAATSTSASPTTEAKSLRQTIEDTADGKPYLLTEAHMEDFIDQTCQMQKSGTITDDAMAGLLLGYPEALSQASSGDDDDAVSSTFAAVYLAGLHQHCPKQAGALIATLGSSGSSDDSTDDGDDYGDSDSTPVFAWGKTYTSPTTGNKMKVLAPKQITVSSYASHDHETAQTRTYEVDTVVSVPAGGKAVDMSEVMLSGTSDGHDAGLVFDDNIDGMSDATVLPGHSYTLRTAFDVVPGSDLQVEVDFGITTTAIWHGSVN